MTKTFMVTITTKRGEKMPTTERIASLLYGSGRHCDSIVQVDVTEGELPKKKDEQKPDITRWPDILSPKDVEELRDTAARIGWGFTRESLEEQLVMFEQGDTKAKARVFYLLEDCNYHDVAGALAKYDVAGARRIADGIYNG